MLTVSERRACRALGHLSGFAGVLQVDGYGGYKALADRGGIQLAFCWAHVRRRFYELAQGGPAPIATRALERIARLYRTEAEIRGRSAELRDGTPEHFDRHFAVNVRGAVFGLQAALGAMGRGGSVVLMGRSRTSPASRPMGPMRQRRRHSVHTRGRGHWNWPHKASV